jgi:hypothetical protein
MTMSRLPFDFPFEGPWGKEMTATLRCLAPDVASEDGLIWKILRAGPTPEWKCLCRKDPRSLRCRHVPEKLNKTARFRRLSASNLVSIMA